MMSGFDFDIGVAMMSTYDADGFLGIQCDAVGEQDSGVRDYEAHHMLGFCARPMDPVVDPDSGNPDPTQAAQVLFGMEAGRGHAWALQDPRMVVKLPQLKPGESMQYGPAANFSRMHADGSITLYTTSDGTLNGTAQFLRLTPKDGLTYVAPWGKMLYGPNGFHVITAAGARIDMGFVGGMPAPFDGLSSYITMNAGTISLEAGALSLGPNDGTAVPVARGAETAEILTAIQLAMNVIATALASASAVQTSGITPAQSAAFAAANVALNLLSPLTILGKLSVS